MFNFHLSFPVSSKLRAFSINIHIGIGENWGISKLGMAIRIQNRINPLTYGSESESVIWKTIDCGFGLFFSSEATL